MEAFGFVGSAIKNQVLAARHLPVEHKIHWKDV